MTRLDGEVKEMPPAAASHAHRAAEGANGLGRERAHPVAGEEDLAGELDERRATAS